ncbi:MAG TPA: hypothetical protein VK195_16745 [Burkholderiaceae bacterium]|nr:hypothetical protein [Burkholderiaceae bacterium]
MQVQFPVPSLLPRRARLSRRPALALVAAALLAGLGGCGGSPGSEIADAYSCAFTNCKSSTEVAPQDLRLGGSLTREDGRVNADLGLSYRANLLTNVRLSSPDALWLMPGQVPVTSRSGPDGTLEAQVDSTQDSWTVRLFHRGQTYDSTVVLPAPVQIRAPAPASLLRSQAQFSAGLSGPSGTVPQIRLAEGDCQLADGRSARWAGYKAGPQARLVSTSGDQSQYGVSMEALQQSLDEAAASALSAASTAGISVKQCRFSLVWAHSITGTVAPGLSSHGVIFGISQARQTLGYTNDR